MTDKRLRPFVGIAEGTLMAQSQFTLVEGNIFDGITWIDFKLEDRANFFIFGSGLDYRLGKNTGLRLNLSYFMSGDFEKPTGGFKSYKGFSLDANFLIIL